MNNTVFLQKNSKFYISSKVNVILSCELYWVRIFDIPINSYKEVIEALPSFFDDYFDVSDYKYFAIKLDKSKYLSFAYNENDIVQIIKNSGLEFKNIVNIYFAQNELINIFENDLFYEIEENIYCKQDDILVLLPANIAKTVSSKELKMDNINLSKHKIYINQSSRYIDVKTAYTLSSILIIFSLINFTKTISINQNIISIDNNTKFLKNKYNLPNSMIQTKSILKEYETIKIRYDKVRTSLDYILKYKKVANAKLKDIEYKSNEIVLKCENKYKDKIEKYLTVKYKILSSDIYNNNLEIRIEI
jgi:hypothetical protein